MSFFCQDLQMTKWDGAEVPSRYLESLDELIAKSFYGIRLSEVPLPDKRWVAIYNGSVVAHACVQARSFQINDHIYHGFVLGEVCTDPTFRHKGFGTMVTRALLSELNTEKGAFVVLNCGERVREFYEKMGFIEVSSKAQYIREEKIEIDDDPVFAMALIDSFDVEMLKTAIFPMEKEF